MQLTIKESSSSPSKTINTEHLSDEQLHTLSKKYIKGCNKIYHEPGYMNSKGDAPYDFTCNSSHLCQVCRHIVNKVSQQTTRRNDQKVKQENRKKTLNKLKEVREKYFNGKPGCECTKEAMCKECLGRLQADVTKYEQGCGAEWEEEFGGMAAGPAWVTCYDNYFLCQKCSQQLAFIKRLQKQNPHIHLAHIQQKQKMFWAPRTHPYYYGHL